MFKIKTSAYVYKKVFNLMGSTNNTVVASNEIQQFLNNYGYRTKIIKTTDYASIKYSLSNLYKSYDFVINDCSSLKNDDITKLTSEIKNNDYCSWLPYQVFVCNSNKTQTYKENVDLIYNIEESTNKKENDILQKGLN